MNQTPTDPRARLRQLLSIPEAKRTDEEWDEIVAIEIDLGPGKANVVARMAVPRNEPSPGNPQQQHQGKKQKGQWKPKQKKKPQPQGQGQG